MSDTREIQAALAAPFHKHQLRWKPQAVKNDRALCVIYLDARAVMDRLDEVLGLGNWQTSYTAEGKGGTVTCTLSIRINGEWISHQDVGSESEQPDEGDRQKSAHSDALKRAAVHIGIGRYLYRLGQQWLGYDPQRKRFTEDPKVPLPAKPRVTPRDGLPQTTAKNVTPHDSLPPAEDFPYGANTQKSPTPTTTLPKAQTWEQFLSSVDKAELDLVKRKVCTQWELFNLVAEDLEVEKLEELKPTWGNLDSPKRARESLTYSYIYLVVNAIRRELDRTGLSSEDIYEKFNFDVSKDEMPSHNVALAAYEYMCGMSDAEGVLM
jgi:hypothetical protein